MAVICLLCVSTIDTPTAAVMGWGGEVVKTCVQFDQHTATKALTQPHTDSSPVQQEVCIWCAKVAQSVGLGYSQLRSGRFAIWVRQMKHTGYIIYTDYWNVEAKHTVQCVMNVTCSCRIIAYGLKYS